LLDQLLSARKLEAVEARGGEQPVPVVEQAYIVGILAVEARELHHLEAGVA